LLFVIADKVWVFLARIRNYLVSRF